ncbi:hypothetical protein AQI88_10065 [Streptomyces cellostaticus]|uniref:ATP-grasp domain-containing protein n=1 Tax=Streptomyces cellostaticus TaxID=67285 RepID=A0A124HD90_9ACTN|nr:hypothetical protein [Streptomyces cellostaticus]KUM96828.1 hypothetical protein AQI88_10065 [Streptomyces cellostaticus]GHI05748.1 hypothetical protein Scel_40690 [Streptomyces cellostaticus]
MKEDNDVRRIFLLNPDPRLVREAALAGVQVRSVRVDVTDESALRVPLAQAAEAGLCVNPARALRVLSDPAAVQRLVRDNRLSPGGTEAAPGDLRLTVETLSVHGMHQAVGITARMPYGLLHPAPLTDDTAAEVRAVVTALLDLAGYQYGPAHAEVTLTPGGPVITGCRAGLGDDPVPELLKAAGGFDLAAGAIEVLAGRLVHAARPNRFAAAAVLAPPWLLETAEVGVLPHVRFVAPPEAPRPGHFVVHADSPEVAARRVASLRTLVVGDDR